MMKKWLLLKNIPISRLECKNHTQFMTKMAKIDTLFMTKTAENHTLWGHAYLYSPWGSTPSQDIGTPLKKELNKQILSTLMLTWSSSCQVIRFVGSNKLLDTCAKISTSSSVLTLPSRVFQSANVTSMSTAITKSPPKISGGLCVLFTAGLVRFTSCERTCWAVVFDWKPSVTAPILKREAKKWET